MSENKKEDTSIEKYGIVFSDEEVMKTYELATETFARTLYPPIKNIEREGYYNALYANDIVKDITSEPIVPSLKRLIQMLKNPSENEYGMRGLSHYLDYNVFQYKRSVKYFASMFTLNYKLVPTKIPTQKEKKLFTETEQKVFDWLNKFNIKRTFANVLQGVMLEDAKFYYVRESKDFIDLQELPSDYCYITGDSSIGYTFAFDLLWFAKYGYTDKDFPKQEFAPEFEEWFYDFLKIWRDNKFRLKYYKQPLSREKSVVFKFDNIRAAIVPPLSGVFKDALEIQEYKDLLKVQTQLDTWKIIFQEIPLNKETGKPSIDAKTVGKFVSTTQSRMPTATKTMASPMKPHVINFESGQTRDKIIGKGNEQYWDGVGVAKPLNGGSDVNSAGALKLSIISDYGFVSDILHEFEAFVNYQLSLITGKFKFKIKFMQNDTLYNNRENQELASKNAQFGGDKLNWMAYQGIEPHEIRTSNWYEKHLGLEKRTPLTSSHTASQTKDKGRQSKNTIDLAESGEITQQYDSNSDK